ncbi:MAG TPA: hypothetical protein VL017_06735 [Devosia sp.]|nr:hypothetical protein [Devosia sp.]
MTEHGSRRFLTSSSRRALTYAMGGHAWEVVDPALHKFMRMAG